MIVFKHFCVSFCVPATSRLVRWAPLTPCILFWSVFIFCWSTHLCLLAKYCVKHQTTDFVTCKPNNSAQASTCNQPSCCLCVKMTRVPRGPFDPRAAGGLDKNRSSRSQTPSGQGTTSLINWTADFLCQIWAHGWKTRRNSFINELKTESDSQLLFF